MEIVARVSADLGLRAAGVTAVVKLLEEGSTVPFIARYRKEATGGLDEVAIRAIEERREYVVELEDRRRAILESIDSQGKLDDALRAKINACSSKAELEDLYLPYKQKRRTRAMMARERGLEPLANRILEQPATGDPRSEAKAFGSADKDVPDGEAALKGACDIVAETYAESASVRALVRNELSERGALVVEAVKSKTKERTKFEQYYDYREPVRDMPSHRFLAIRRGENEGVLRARIDVDSDKLIGAGYRELGLVASSPFAELMREAIADGYKRLVAPSVENGVRVDMKLRSDRAAVDVFADNLRNLLLGAPLGGKAVIGIDPGLRTGCKCAAVDATGTFLETITIYPSRGEAGEAQAGRDLAAFIAKHDPIAIAVGNGTGGRETEALARKITAADAPGVIVVSVNEAGASVYSASDVAREEFPELDLTIRGAISIARRLQDPLAELVKVEPKAIGVGQYQHDVHQPLLVRKLGEVVESCVNHVGVALNTASAQLLSHVAGLSSTVAKRVVSHRDDKGPFKSRKELLKVSGLGPRAFQQAAGFLRIRDAAHPLDASAVHPERYELVETMAKDLGVTVAELVGNSSFADQIDLSRYVGDGVGEPTLRDIVAELKKPGRDPRKSFEPPKFRDDVHSLEDLRLGMSLEGVVTNVTAFGAFVDVGVHQDGLVHVSQLADRFVKDPADVVKVGDRIRVRVLDVDLERRRISLSARSDAAPAQKSSQGAKPKKNVPDKRKSAPAKSARGSNFSNNPFAALADRNRGK
jgi:uncharacterized protein